MSDIKKKLNLALIENMDLKDEIEQLNAEMARMDRVRGLMINQMTLIKNESINLTEKLEKLKSP